MRFLTILISLSVGIVLGIVFINNGHGVHFNLDPFVRSPFPPETSYRVYPLWAVMLVCVLIGFLLGWLVTVTGSYANAPPPQPKAPPPQKASEPDYLLIDAPVERRKP